MRRDEVQEKEEDEAKRKRRRWIANGQYNFLNDGDRRPANSRDELRWKAASTIPILMNTSNCDLREVFNWGSPPMRERSRGRETKSKRVRGGGGGRWSKDRRAWFFSIADRHYRRSSWRTTLVSCHTLIFAITSRRPRAPIFAKKLSTGTDRPLRAFGTIDKESDASLPVQRGTEERDLVNFVSLLIHLWSAWSLRISLDDLGARRWS